MNQRRAATASVSLFIGVAIVLSVLYRVWQPTVGNPNFWENNTGGLFPLVLQAMLAGGLVVAGVAIAFDGAVRKFRSVDVRAAGAAGIIGGLLGYGPVVREVATATGAGRVVHFGLDTAALALLAAAVAGLAVRYSPLDSWGRYGAGAVAGGFLMLAGENLLLWTLASVEPRSGALSYPPLGLRLVGTLALAVGSVLLGWSLLNNDDAPSWLASFLLVAGLLALPLGVLSHFQYVVAAGGYGLAWIVVGIHLLAGQSDTASRIE